MKINDLLTPNFTVREYLAYGEGTKIFPPERLDKFQVENIRYHIGRLQVIREILNKKIKITSGFRSVAWNNQIGGEKNSYHTKGLATDITVEGMTPEQVYKMLDPGWVGGLGLYSTWVHIDSRGYKSRWKG